VDLKEELQQISVAQLLGSNRISIASACVPWWRWRRCHRCSRREFAAHLAACG
jgi:hypothetical protein